MLYLNPLLGKKMKKQLNKNKKINFVSAKSRKIHQNSTTHLFGPKESCGVFGVLAHDEEQQVSEITYHGLMALQHRGQEAAGLSVVNGTRKIHTFKDQGLVFQVLTPEVLKKYGGNVSIGHVRYGTAGSASVKNAQPYQFDSTYCSFSLVFNGNICNYDHLKEGLIKKGRIFTTDSDTEVLANLLAIHYNETKYWVESLRRMSQQLDGSYSIILMVEEGELYAFRDPTGFKPLVIGELEGNCKYDLIASESCAFDCIGGKLIRDVLPGEIVHFKAHQPFKSEAIVPGTRIAHCFFEYVYFARPDSIIDGVPVEDVRKRLGINLAKDHPVKSDNAIIVPVPDSGRSGSIGFAEASGVPYEEGLMKNRYVWRTFIMPGKEKRMNMVREKLNPIKSVISNKEVVLIDDSIVRGTTTQRIVKLLKDAGAAKVHLRITCPPVIEPCYMGIDFPTKSELIAGREDILHHNNYVDCICKELCADSLGYQTIESLVKAIGIPKEQLCLACINGDYPLKTDPRKSNLTETFSKDRN